MKAKRALTVAAVASVDLTNHQVTFRNQCDSRADCVSVAVCARQFDLQPVILASGFIAIEGAILSLVGDVDVEVTIIIEVGDGQSPSVVNVGQADLFSDLRKHLVPVVAPDSGGLIAGEGRIPHRWPVLGVDRIKPGLGHRGRQFGEVLVSGDPGNVSVGHHDIEVPIVVVIPEFPRPAPAAVVDFSLKGNIAECLVAHIPVELIPLFYVLLGPDVTDVEVEPAVVVEITELDIHPLVSVPADGLVSHVREGSVGIHAINTILAEVVGICQILVAVVVVVGSAGVERPSNVVHTHFLSDVSEGSVAVIAIEHVGPGIPSGFEILVHCPRAFQSPQMFVAKVVPDIEIEVTIVIVIEPDGRVPVTPVTHASRLGYVRESAVPVIVIENVRSPLDDIQIQMAVIVIIPPYGVHTGAPVFVNLQYVSLSLDRISLAGTSDAPAFSGLTNRDTFLSPAQRYAVPHQGVAQRVRKNAFIQVALELQVYGKQQWLPVRPVNARLPGHVREGHVAVVAEQLVWLVQLRVDDIEVNVTILVVVGGGYRGAHRRHPGHDAIQLRIQDTLVMPKANACLISDVHERLTGCLGFGVLFRHRRSTRRIAEDYTHRPQRKEDQRAADVTHVHVSYPSRVARAAYHATDTSSLDWPQVRS